MNQKEEALSAVVQSIPSQSSILGWGMVLAYVILNSLGALTLKGQVERVGPWHFDSARSYFEYFLALFSSVWTWIGFMSVGASSAAWLVALNKLELSRAHPMAIGFNLILVFCISFYNFNEAFTTSKTIGIFLILSGIAILYK